MFRLKHGLQCVRVVYGNRESEPFAQSAVPSQARVTVCSCGVSVLVWCVAIVRVNNFDRSRVSSHASVTVCSCYMYEREKVVVMTSCF